MGAWHCGGVVTQRSAKPRTPVQFRSVPPFLFEEYCLYTSLSAPLYFVRSGSIYLSIGYLGNAGVYSLYWSLVAASVRSTGIIVPSAYGLRFNASGVSPSFGPNYRWFGRPLRGLASGGGSHTNDRLAHWMNGHSHY